ncbi:hypothetical protein SLEP1_g33173 [Rubroshorea leprosula]|uniref:Transmembrane protein n=1 Tax=Rubroshorea leprosula TaxID=152421 RepID=A0AAV5KFZ6_9ROSI|nr:hypothetical protein SLEP1_g33173 [Rubroshorea leprosula]
MSLKTLFTSSPPCIALPFNPALRNRSFSPPIASRHIIVDRPFPHNSLRLHISRNSNFKSHQSFSPLTLGAYKNDSTSTPAENKNSYESNLDSFLLASELIIIFSSAVISITFAANYAVSRWKSAFLGDLWRRVMVVGVVGLVGQVIIGAWIRRRQWRRIYVESLRGNEESLNLVERIEKLEEDLKSSGKIILALSKQLEELGIRFRETRKTLTGPISEDQQQKQLELVLAIGKLAKLWESKQEASGKQEASNLTEEAGQLEIHESQASYMNWETINDRA